MVFEPVLADVAQKVLQVRDLHDADAAESLKGVAGERAVSDIAAHPARDVVGRPGTNGESGTLGKGTKLYYPSRRQPSAAWLSA